MIGRLIIMVNTRLELKYDLDCSCKSDIANDLLNVYFEKRVSYPMKVKIIELLKRLFKNTKIQRLNVSNFPWRGLWGEAMKICLRSQKYDSIACEMLVSSHFGSLINLLHISRHHINDEDAYVIV